MYFSKLNIITEFLLSTGGCSENEFQCMDDNTCVAENLRCNAQNNCKDGSDELDCGMHYPTLIFLYNP